MIVENVRLEVAPFYETNDAAHRLNHADDVYSMMVFIISKESINVNRDDVCFAAYYHDMYSDVFGNDLSKMQDEISSLKLEDVQALNNPV